MNFKEVRKSDFAFLIKEKCQLLSVSMFQVAPPSVGNIISGHSIMIVSSQTLCFIGRPWEGFSKYLDVLNKENKIRQFTQ